MFFSEIAFKCICKGGIVYPVHNRFVNFSIFLRHRKIERSFEFFLWSFKIENIFSPLKSSKFVVIVAQIDGCGAGSVASGVGWGGVGWGGGEPKAPSPPQVRAVAPQFHSTLANLSHKFFECFNCKKKYFQIWKIIKEISKSLWIFLSLRKIEKFTKRLCTG
jgi:hypothetical protein